VQSSIAPTVSSLSIPAIVAFAALTVAAVALWVPGRRTWWLPAWLLPLAASLVAAAAAGIVSSEGLAAIAALALACVLAARHPARWLRGAAHAVMLAVTAGLLLHAVPGFDNPRVLHEQVLTPDAVPYTKYLNYDKGLAGLLLLGLYAPALARGDEGLRHFTGFAWRVTVLIAVVMALSLAVGYVRWEPKLPSWWPVWTWSMVVLTAFAEEMVFRGLLQSWIETWLGGTSRAAVLAVIIAGGLFGLAHAAGGPLYVVLATVAGLGYGWIFSSTRSIGAAIAAHAGLNTVHFFLFTYPALHLP
jgi:membrane protease YdiL (CAAX protease family)